MMIPINSKPERIGKKFNALGVTQYGQMTAGSLCTSALKEIVSRQPHHEWWMPFRKKLKKEKAQNGKSFLTKSRSGRWVEPRRKQEHICWLALPPSVQKSMQSLQENVMPRLGRCLWIEDIRMSLSQPYNSWQKANQEVSFSNSFHREYWSKLGAIWPRKYFCGARLWSNFNSTILGAGGYYPVGLSFEESNETYCIHPNFSKPMFKKASKTSHCSIISHTANRNAMSSDYGNAFLLEF